MKKQITEEWGGTQALVRLLRGIKISRNQRERILNRMGSVRGYRFGFGLNRL